MAWKVELDEAAEHELDKLDPQVGVSSFSVQ